ncbi:MAG: trans-aconitate 2-methyltransferase [Actinomycetota bacterium]
MPVKFGGPRRRPCVQVHNPPRPGLPFPEIVGQNRAMFAKSQAFYDAIYSWKDYPAEVEKIERVIRARVPHARTLLDVACGTGKHLELLRERYEVEGVDLDPGLLAVARERLPDVPLHEADMREFDLGRTFDVVTCLFSAIGYARGRKELGRSIAAMARHVSPRGALVVEPWLGPDVWQEGHVNAVLVDRPGLKIARMNRADRDGQMSVMEMHYLVGTPGEGVQHFTEHHEMTLFRHDEYVDAFRAAGLNVDHDPEGLTGRGLYVASSAV